MVTRFFVYGALGCLMEVIWTGLGSFINGDFKLKANTSIWMFFIYGLLIFLEPLYRLLAAEHLLLRAAAYSAFIFAGEYISGSLLKRAEICPWDYSGSKYHVRGVIRLDYAPAWMAAGLFFERVYWFLQ